VPPVDSFRSRLRGRSDARRDAQHSEAFAASSTLLGASHSSPETARPGVSPSRSSGADTCSEAEAQTLARKYRLGDSTYNYPVGPVLCGAFTGPQSNAIAFSFHYYGCIPTSGFAVFHFDAGDWQLVLKRPDVAVSLFAAGPDIRETVAVFRKGDSRCVWTGGTRARVWHWDGQQLVPSAWKQLTPPKKKQQTPPGGGFKTPSGNIFCNYAYGYDAAAPVPFLYCGIKSGIKPPAPRKGPQCTRALWPEIRRTGRAFWVGSTCPGHDEPQGPVVELARTVLRYGKSWSWNGMRCSSAFAGLTCRNQSGHGFVMSSARTRLF
jgi:hypothetical protein